MLPSFINAAFLAGLGALIAPILIHLWLRRKSQRVRFSTIQFFEKRTEQSSRRRKLRNLFLLSLRLLLFALIVLSFARPYLPSLPGSNSPGSRQQVVFLLDGTSSMQAIGGKGEVWKASLDIVRQTLRELRENDRAALILVAGQGRVVSEFAPPSVLMRKLNDVEPAFEQGELQAGLKRVLTLLRTADPKSPVSLHVVSDLQRNGAQNLFQAPLPEDLKIVVHDLGDRFLPNVAVSSLELNPDGSAGLRAELGSYSDQAISNLKVSLKLDGKDQSVQTTTLPRGRSTNVTFRFPNVSPGWHSAQVSLETKDSLGADNVGSIAWLEPSPVRVLVVETRSGMRSFQEQTFFLASALDPRLDPKAPAGRFQVTKVSPSELGSALAPKGGQRPFDLVFIPGLKEPSASQGEALRKFAGAGGGVIFFLDDNISPNRYESAFAGLLPGRLERMESVAANDPSWRIGQTDRKSRVFAPFQSPLQGDLLIPEFLRRFRITPSAQSTVLAAFDDSVPLVLAAKQEKVALVNMSADASATDWPKHKTFVPFIHGLAEEFAGAELGVQRAKNLAQKQNGSAVDLGSAFAGKAFKLRSDAGVEKSVSADAKGVLRDLPISKPGIYSLVDGEGREVRRLASNFPPAESDLTGMAPHLFEGQLARRGERLAGPAVAGLFGNNSQGRELWRILLLSALALLMIEPFVANRTSA